MCARAFAHVFVHMYSRSSVYVYKGKKKNYRHTLEEERKENEVNRERSKMNTEIRENTMVDAFSIFY